MVELRMGAYGELKIGSPGFRLAAIKASPSGRLPRPVARSPEYNVEVTVPLAKLIVEVSETFVPVTPVTLVIADFTVRVEAKSGIGHGFGQEPVMSPYCHQSPGLTPGT